MPDVNLNNSQAGIIGDNAYVEGGIHFYREIITYDGVEPISADNLLDACQKQVAMKLNEAQYKYNPTLYVNRVIEQDLNAFFDTPPAEAAPNCFLIVAPAGSGKTSLLCNLAQARVSKQPVLLLMSGSICFSGTAGLLDVIKTELEIASPAVAFRSAGAGIHILNDLAEKMERDVLVFLDAINEHRDPAAMNRAVEDLLYELTPIC